MSTYKIKELQEKEKRHWELIVSLADRVVALENRLTILEMQSQKNDGLSQVEIT